MLSAHQQVRERSQRKFMWHRVLPRPSAGVVDLLCFLGTRYQGVLCGVCMDDYQFSAGQCLECPEGDLPWPSYVVMVLVLLIAVAILDSIKSLGSMLESSLDSD